MRALLDKVFLVACSSHLGPEYILPALSGLPGLCGEVCCYPKTSLHKGWDLLSLAALRIFSLSLEFASFTIKCQGVKQFLLILVGISLSPGSECLLPSPS